MNTITVHYDRPIGMTGSLPSGVPSDHAVTKSSLEQRKLRFTPQDTEPLDFISIWSDVLALRMPQVDASDCLRHLANAMNSSYRDEAEFDEALFNALLTGLGSSVTLETISTTRTVGEEVKKKKRRLIAINNLRWSETDSNGFLNECAIAFATQVTSKGDLDIPESIGCASSSRHDHSCVLISRKAKRKDGTGGHYNWKVRESLASVELKRQKQSFLLKKTTKKRRTNDRNPVYSVVERINSPLKRAGYGALWQAIAYTISDVWTCLARRGARNKRSADHEDAVKAAVKPSEGDEGLDQGEDDPPPSDIPFAIISCAIINERGQEQLCRYAYGRVGIPKVCGEQFSFCLVSGETFDGENVTNSVNAAAAAYIKVLSFGVSMGGSIVGRALSYGKNFYSMAGRELHLFDKDVTESFELFRSPISTQKYGVSASQGEIWRGGLESAPKLGALNVETFKFADFDSVQLSSLLVKCPSIMVHNPLVGSSDNWSALSKISSRNAEKCINNVLLYTEKSISAGSVKMLMRDLSSTHQDLRPSQYKNQLPKLWGLFCKLVRSTLLVLAELGIVHPDIRPGYDFTSNILLHLSRTDEVETEGEDEMVLIDLDSLIHLVSWENLDSPAYLNMVDQNSYSYVWWQCFAVAITWKQEKKQDSNTDGGFGYTTLQNKFDLVFEQSECTAVHVESLLTKISASDWFGEQQLTDERVAGILDGILLPLEATDSR